MSPRLALGDIDIFARTGGHFAIATRLRRRRGWWLVRDSGVCLTTTSPAPGVTTKRRNRLLEQQIKSK